MMISIHCSVIYQHQKQLLSACLFQLLAQLHKLFLLSDSSNGHQYPLQDCLVIMPPRQCWKHPSPFSNVHFRNTTKIAQVLALNFQLSFTFEPLLKL